MTFLYRLEDAIFGPLIRALDAGLLSLMVRFSFLAVLWLWLWNSAVTKVYNSREGFSLFPKLGAYGQMFPAQLEAAGYDIGQLGTFYHVVAFAGTYGEFILPILIVIGLFTRTAALGMIVFIGVLTYVDVYGHKIKEKAVAAYEAARAKIDESGEVHRSITAFVKEPDPIGRWFDGVVDAPIVDVRTFWVVALLVLVAKGGGWLSVDSLLRRSRAE